MTIDPVTANYRKHRAAVTRAERSGDPARVLAACDAAIVSFDAIGWPDDWTHFQRAADDASFGARIY